MWPFNRTEIKYCQDEFQVIKAWLENSKKWMLPFTFERLDFSSVDKPTVIIVITKASTSKIINKQ